MPVVLKIYGNASNSIILYLKNRLKCFLSLTGFSRKYILVLLTLCFSISSLYAARDKPHTTETLVRGKKELGKPTYGGTIRLATISDPKTFNLIIAQETSTTEAVGIIFEGLTRINGVTTEPEPCLATGWSHSPDGLQWTFTLRQGVKWFDGVEFTADDVVFTYNELIYNKDIPCSFRDIITIDGKIFKVEKLDKYRVLITTPTPFAPLLRHLGHSILPKHILEESVKQGKFAETWGVNTPPEKLIGTGPFKLTEYLPVQRLVYKRNPNYWQKGLPYIDCIVRYIVQNLDVQLMKFRAGETDILSVQGKDYALIKKEAAKKNYTVYDCGAAFGTNFICFNQNINDVEKTKWNWFSNLRFRQAVAYALDKESMINNVLFGIGQSQYAAMSEAATFFHNPNVKRYPYNPQKAKELLKESGFVDNNNDGILEKPPGVPVKFILLTNANNNERVDLGTIIQSDLKAIGLDVSFRPIDFNNLVNKLNYTHDWDAVLIGLTGGIEPHGGKNVWAIDGHLHIWNLKPQITQIKKSQINTYKEKLKLWGENIPDWEKEIDKLFNNGVQKLDPAERKKIYWKWQEIVAENLPLIYTVSSKAVYAVHNHIKGTQPTAYGGVLHNIEEIWIEKPSNK